LTCPGLSGTFCTMTRRTGPAARVRPPLTELESEVMRVVWDSGPCPVEAVHEVVSRKRDLKETSVRTILRRLEQKGYLRHQEQGRAYVYRAAEPARSLAARAVRQIIDRFCKGSVEDLVTGMVESKMLSKGELDRLEALVRNAEYVRSEKKKGGK
jgi:BlaI family transcriptional regulator, penicillinase repressor